MNSNFTRGTENLFTPEEDVFKTTEDGRKILVARAGTPIPMAKAKEAGLLKTEPETKTGKAEKAEKATENKKTGATENKSEVKKDGDQT